MSDDSDDVWTVNDERWDDESLTLASLYAQKAKLDRQIGRKAIEGFIREKVQSLVDSGVLPAPIGGFRIEWED